LFSTLFLQILLEYADRISGFSHLFGDSQVENMKKSLSVLREKRQQRLLKIEDDGSESEDVKEIPTIRQKVSSLVAKPFKFRGRTSTSVDVEAK
jgi:spore cortex formation protein SpoVR/YcgB (stage V sporulation)